MKPCTTRRSASSSRGCANPLNTRAFARARRQVVFRRRHCATAPAASADSAASDSVEWQERINAIKVIKRSWVALKPAVWPAVWLFVAQTLFIFFVDRFTHRLVNATFLQVAGSAFTDADVGSLWFLSQNPEVTSFATGYNWISYGLGLATFPLSAAANCVCICALYRLAAPHMGLAWKELTMSAQPPPEATVAADSAADAPSTAEDQSATDGAEGGQGSKFSARAAQAADTKQGKTQHTSVLAAIAAKTGTEPVAAVETNDAENDAGEAAAEVSPPPPVTPPPPPPKKRDRLLAFKTAWRVSREAITADLKRTFLACLLVSAAEYALVHVSNMLIWAPLLLGPAVIGWQLALPFACLEGAPGAAALGRSWRWIRQGRMLAATGIALFTVFVIELAAPCLTYITLSVVPQRIVVAVPEVMAGMLVASQTVVCVFAQMRYLLPLVLYKAAKEPAAVTAPAA